MPPRPLVFALGLLTCLAGAITCATAPADAGFPSLPDGLIIGGLVLLVAGVAGRAPRGRQLLGRGSSDERPAPGSETE